MAGYLNFQNACYLFGTQLTCRFNLTLGFYIHHHYSLNITYGFSLDNTLNPSKDISVDFPGILYDKF